MSTNLQLQHYIKNGIYIIQASGEFDETNVDKSFEEIRTFLKPNDEKKCVIFDLKDVSYVNSKFIGYTAEISNHLEEFGWRMVLTNTKNVSDILEICGISQIIEIFETLDDWKKYLREMFGDYLTKLESEMNDLLAQEQIESSGEKVEANSFFGQESESVEQQNPSEETEQHQIDPVAQETNPEKSSEAPIVTPDSWDEPPENSMLFSETEPDSQLQSTTEDIDLPAFETSSSSLINENQEYEKSNASDNSSDLFWWDTQEPVDDIEISQPDHPETQEDIQLIGGDTFFGGEQATEVESDTKIETEDTSAQPEPEKNDIGMTEDSWWVVAIDSDIDQMRELPENEITWTIESINTLDSIPTESLPSSQEADVDINPNDDQWLQASDDGAEDTSESLEDIQAQLLEIQTMMEQLREKWKELYRKQQQIDKENNG